MTADGRLALHAYREGGPGLPLVLLHGFLLDHRMWDGVAARLPSSGPVWAPDLPGFGRSPMGGDVADALGVDKAPALEIFADAVASTLDEIGIHRAVISGLSMGGYTAMALVERHPGLVAGLALVDTKSTADSLEAAANRERIAARVEKEGTVDAVMGMGTSLLGESNRRTRPDLVEQMEEWIRDQSPSAVVWAERAMAARPDRTEVLRAFTGPAVVIVGDEDELAPPAEAEHMQEALGAPGVLVRIPRAGHMTTIEDPAPVAAALAAIMMRVVDLEGKG